MLALFTNPDTEYDWREVFGCAGDPDGQNNPADVRRALPTSTVSIQPFGRADVAEVYAFQQGENDDPNWLAFGRLTDGRYFFLSAGYDYTGWDYSSEGHAFVANDKDELVVYGMDADERAALKVAI